MKKFVVFVVLAMVVIGLCAAQSASNDAQRIVGTWADEEGTLVFNANGTGTWLGVNFFYGISVSGSLYMYWPSQRDRLTTVLYMSPDGRRMSINGGWFVKR